MQLKDIPDELVIGIARKHAGFVTWWDLVDLGIPGKLALRKLEQLDRKGILGYGVSVTTCWLNDPQPKDGE